MNQDLGLLIGENRNLLLQTRELIEQLSEEQYQRAHPEIGSNSLGEHVRHLIEHYEVFLASSQSVDYDGRERHPAPQRSTSVACRRLDELCDELDALTGGGSDGEAPMRLRYHPDDGSADAELELGTTVARELAFVASHTLHHMALIRMLAVHMGIEPAADFGVARATRLQDTGRLPAASVG
jgi:uncharacterized damage-inducible protein DinB